MRYLIAALLSAVLITLRPHSTDSGINNSGAVVTTVQSSESVKQPRSNAEQITKPVTPGAPVTMEVEQSKPEPEAPKPQAKVAVQKVITDKQQLMQQAGIPENDWQAVDYIVSHESSWKVSATNPRSGAYGLCQALPASKMASAGDDYKSNPVTQLKWCHSYAHDRYKGWARSFAFWQANSWW